MDLNELQTQVDQWINEHGGYWGSFQILARLTEELGGVGDLLFTLAAFANQQGIDLNQSLAKAMDKYQTRDSVAWKESIKTCAS